MQRLQNRGLRVCLRAPQLESVATLQERPNISLWETRRKIEILKSMFHLIHSNPSLHLITSDGVSASTRPDRGLLFNIDVPRSSNI